MEGGGLSDGCLKGLPSGGTSTTASKAARRNARTIIPIATANRTLVAVSPRG